MTTSERSASDAASAVESTGESALQEVPAYDDAPLERAPSVDADRGGLPSTRNTSAITKWLRDERVVAFLGRWGVAGVALLTSVIITIRSHLFFIIPFAAPVSNDEGYLAGMALRMIRGHFLPYVDGVSQRGPLLYWITSSVMRVCGQWSWVPMRGMGLALSLLETVLAFTLGSLLFSPMAGGIAAMVVTYFLNYELNPWDGIGVNGEPLAVVFAMGAAILVARIQLHGVVRRDRSLIWAGVLSAFAGLSKQMFLLHMVPLVLWVCLGRKGETTRDPKQLRRDLTAFGLGFGIPYLIVVGIYTVTGNLRTFLYYYQRYGREIFMDPLTGEYIRDKIHEEIDKYFLGIAAVMGVWFYALGQALRDILNAGGPREKSTQSITRFAPELHVVANLLVPGLGAVALRRKNYVGVLALGATVATILVRAVLRQRVGVPYSVVSLTRDTMIWGAAGVLSGVATVLVIRRAEPTTRWGIFEGLRARPEMAFAVVQMACAFTGACFTFRFFPHYFVEFFPFAGVVIGAVCAGSFEKLDDRDRPGLLSASMVVLGGMMVLAIANSALLRNVRLRRETDRWYQEPAADPVVRYVAEHTSPDQSIFVWGFRAETYLSAHRYPASRFVYTVYPAGVVPWFQSTHEEEERRVVPGSREILLEELDREMPELIIDAGRSMNGRYMYNYPTLRAYLDRQYCFMRYVDGEPVYRRRHGERCPPADY